MTLVLDAGALIGVERRDRRVLAHLRIAELAETPVVTSAVVAAQVWRGARQANLARVLRGVGVEPLSGHTFRPVGELLRAAGTADVADAHLALLSRAGDTVLTSDPDDLRALLTVRDVRASIVPI